MKYIIGTTILIGILLVFALYDKLNIGSANVQEVVSPITVAESSYDFGDIDIFGGTVNTEYVLKNEGSEDVRVISAVTSCICTSGEIGSLKFGMHESSGGPVVIPAGGEKVLTAIYDPLAHGPDGTGKIKRELMLKTNSTATPEVQVTFTANVVKDETE